MPATCNISLDARRGIRRRGAPPPHEEPELVIVETRHYDHELQERVGGAGRRAKQVQKSTALRAVLEHALALGNYLNGGTNKGAAWGFTLDTLSKLSGTKTI